MDYGFMLLSVFLFGLGTLASVVIYSKVGDLGVEQTH